ncbi:hypothetical protein [Methanosarcina sp. UBA5]|uniref:hypothetical protein n=1 Tax=Methanosarcina sp. UBA5 TaxID=1915593 RepID=UPI0025EAB5CC|nr:hypothetical protein [Methanosarcina sp. UBA5]
MKKHNEKDSRIEKLKYSNSESATATVIGAVLLLGIIFSVLVIIWVGCVPEWKNDAERSHMDNVWKDMADVKSKIDMMSIILASTPDSSKLNTSNPSSSAPQLVMNVPFHMGGGSLPIIGTTKSSGILAVNKDKCIMSAIVIYNDSTSFPFNISCGTITYASQNHYYVDQSFSYEGGALILDQGKQPVMMLYPSIRFSKASSNQYNISINAVRIFRALYDSPQIISSNSGCSLRLTGIDYRHIYDSDEYEDLSIERLVLTIYTTHPDAWKQYLSKMLADAGIDDYTLVENEDNNNVRLIFPKLDSTATGTLKRLYISETVVKAEPGIGLN